MELTTFPFLGKAWLLLFCLMFGTINYLGIVWLVVSVGRYTSEMPGWVIFEIASLVGFAFTSVVMPADAWSPATLALKAVVAEAPIICIVTPCIRGIAMIFNGVLPARPPMADWDFAHIAVWCVVWYVWAALVPKIHPGHIAGYAGKVGVNQNNVRTMLGVTSLIVMGALAYVAL